MRDLDLQQVHDELLHLIVEQAFDAARVTPVLDVVRADLQQAKRWPNSGTEPTIKKPLASWWSSYRGLGDLIPK